MTLFNVIIAVNAQRTQGKTKRSSSSWQLEMSSEWRNNRFLLCVRLHYRLLFVRIIACISSVIVRINRCWMYEMHEWVISLTKSAKRRRYRDAPPGRGFSENNALDTTIKIKSGWTLVIVGSSAWNRYNIHQEWHQSPGLRYTHHKSGTVQ